MRTEAWLRLQSAEPEHLLPKAKPQRAHRMSARSLAAVAMIVAGAVIAAQAAFMPAKAQVAQVLLDRAWQTRVETGEAARPWPWADFTPEARLSFPELGRHVLALSDAAGESMAFGPSRVAASAKPGEPGVAVYAAHRDTHFRFLDRLKPGDPVIVQTHDRTLEYKVIGSSVVPWNASGISMHPTGASRIALVTCWPLDAKVRGPMRYVVWAERVEQADA